MDAKTVSELCELLMLICFGASWPFSLLKTIQTKNPVGKSLVFLFLVLIGYVAGMLFKIFGNMNYVFAIYVLNTVMVAADLVMVLYYRGRNARAKRQ